MSARTFYASFSGKEDLMAAAIDSACAQAVAAVLPAFSRRGEWPEAVRAGFGALLDFLASRPALGRLVTVEVYAAGDAERPRPTAAAPGVVPSRAPARPTVSRALAFLERGPATPRRIAVAVGEDVAVVRRYMADLAAMGAAGEEGEEDGEPLYSSPWGVHRMRALNSQRLATMSEDEREDLTSGAWESIARP